MAFKEKQTPIHEKDSSAHDAESEIMRRFKARPGIFIGTVIVLVLVIVSFVLVPAIVPSAGMGQNVDMTFGSYDKIPITYVPGNYFAQMQYNLTQRYQQSMDPGSIYNYNFTIWQQAFDAAVLHTAVLKEIKDSGYTVPDKSVDKEVAKYFLDEKGQFSNALYQRQSSNDQRAMWQQTQDELAKRLYFNDAAGLQKNEAEADFIAKMASLQRSFDMAVFPVINYPDSEYIAYAREHSDLFRSIHLSKITINSGEREARKILASIKDGTSTFEDAARNHSRDGFADRGGDMGIKSAYELITEIPDEPDREKTLALGKGELSDLVKLETGWVFFRAEDALQPVNIDAMAADETVLSKVRGYVREFERGRMEDWSIAQARDFTTEARASGFERALEQRGLEKRSFGPVPLNYGSFDLFATVGSFGIQQLSNAAANENFWKTAFSTPVRDFSQPLALSAQMVQDSYVLVLYPTEETQADNASIEGIASTYSAYWLSPYMSEAAMQSYFLNSEKMDDRFVPTYRKYFSPAGE